MIKNDIKNYCAPLKIVEGDVYKNTLFKQIKYSYIVANHSSLIIYAKYNIIYYYIDRKLAILHQHIVINSNNFNDIRKIIVC